MPLEVCAGCRAVREFSELRPVRTAAGSALHCPECRANPPAPPADSALEPLWGELHWRNRRILELLFQDGVAFKEAKNQVGLPAHETLRDFLAKRPAMKRAYQAILRARGYDAFYLTQKLEALLHAVRPQWNPATKEFEFFPDTAIQLRALENLQKILEAVPYPKKEGPEPPQLVIVTNIFEAPAERADSGGGPLVFDVTPKPEPGHA